MADENEQTAEGQEQTQTTQSGSGFPRELQALAGITGAPFGKAGASATEEGSPESKEAEKQSGANQKDETETAFREAEEALLKDGGFTKGDLELLGRNNVLRIGSQRKKTQDKTGETFDRHARDKQDLVEQIRRLEAKIDRRATEAPKESRAQPEALKLSKEDREALEVHLGERGKSLADTIDKLGDLRVAQGQAPTSLEKNDTDLSDLQDRLKALTDQGQKPNADVVQFMVSQTRSQFAERIPQLNVPRVWDAVFETMNQLDGSQRYNGLALSDAVPRMMLDALKIHDLNLAPHLKEQATKTKQRINGLPVTDSGSAAPETFSKEEREYQRYLEIERKHGIAEKTSF